MRRLVMMLLAVGMLTAVAAPATAEEIPDQQTQGSSTGYWSSNNPGRWWRFFDNDIHEKCPLGTNPTVKLNVRGTRPAYTDVDHVILQAQFGNHDTTLGPFKEKEVGWFPSLIGEYKFQVSPWPDWRTLKLRHRYTGDVPYNAIKLQGPNGGWLDGIWAGVSWNESVEPIMPSLVQLQVKWWCAS